MMTSGREGKALSVRRLTDRIVAFNLPDRINPLVALETHEPTIETLANGFVARREIVNKIDGRALPTAEWRERAGVYDGQGDRIEAVVRAKGMYAHKLDDPSIMTVDRMSTARFLDFDAVYLGTLHGHFGHFLVETLSRIWALAVLDPDIPVVFHHTGGGAGDPFSDPKKVKFPSFVNAIFEALGIDETRLVLANRDYRFKHLLVPTSFFAIGVSAHARLPEIYATIAAKMKGRSSNKRDIYLSRRRLAELSEIAKRKSVGNEAELETIFATRGFEIVYPETLSFADQVALFGTARMIAGTSGTALHMAMFCANADACVIAIDWRVVHTQYLLEAARGIRAIHIFAPKPGLNEKIIDLDIVERALAIIAQGEEMPGPEDPAAHEPPPRDPPSRHPATDLPATDPPATDLPATDPPARHPPATDLPATDPSRDDPKPDGQAPEILARDGRETKPSSLEPSPANGSGRRSGAPKPSSDQAATRPPTNVAIDGRSYLMCRLDAHPNGTSSARRIARIANRVHARSFLNLWASCGATFNSLAFDRKVAVDPDFAFDIDLFDEPGVFFESSTSDDYFSVEAEGNFDLIYIEGLRPFAQTLRDFCASLAHASDAAAWLIDNVMPGSDEVRGSLPLGHDRYKFVFALHDLFPSLCFATIEDDGRPQTLVWRAPRGFFCPRCDNLTTIERLSYPEALERSDVFNAMTEDRALALLVASRRQGR